MVRGLFLNQMASDFDSTQKFWGASVFEILMDLGPRERVGVVFVRCCQNVFPKIQSCSIAKEGEIKLSLTIPTSIDENE